MWIAREGGGENKKVQKAQKREKREKESQISK